MWDDFHLEYVPVKAKLRSFVPLNGAICIHVEMTEADTELSVVGHQLDVGCQ